MVQWSDSFWGEGNRGFEVLFSNIKNGAIAIEELQRFLAESLQCEAAYSRSLSRLQTQFVKIPNLGTFTPIWILIRDLLDKVSSTHSSAIKLYQDLLRDIHNYQEHYQKKVKAQIQKDGDINRTDELIPQLNNALMIVNKSKEQYHSFILECERIKRNSSHSSNTSSSVSLAQENTSTSLAQSAISSLASKHLDRWERKCRQAQDEYKLTLEKYNTIRNDFEKRFSDAASKFQAFEIDHVERMLALSLSYADILQRNNEQIRVAEHEFTEKVKSLTGNDILDAFVEQKKTGTERPSILQFEEVDHNKPTDVVMPSNSNDMTLLNLDDPGVPNFEANFSVPSTANKQMDTPRSTHSPATDSTMPPPPLMNTASLSTPTQSTIRSPDNNNEQTNNPFIMVKKSRLPNIFGQRRKRDKSLDQKPSTSNNKSSKISKFSRSITKTNETNATTPDLNDFTTITDNPDSFVSRQSNHTPVHSSSSMSNDDARQNRHTFTSSKSQSSSDSSDDNDDDDCMMTKITFKINEPGIQVPSNDDDDGARIMEIMRGLNHGLNSRASNSTNQDMNKSSSTGLINNRSLPPPPPAVARSTTTNPSHSATDLFDAANMFPPQDQFAQFSSNNTTTTTTGNQDASFFPFQPFSDGTQQSSLHLSTNKFTASSSSNDDDTEVANSFHKGISFPVLQVPRAFQTLRAQSSRTNTMSPSVVSMNQNFNNSPIIANEIETPPLTIGANEQIPLAIAFQETIHVKISGENRDNWKSRIVGQMLISFPSSILNLLADSSYSANALEFRLKNLDNIENIVIKPSLIIQNPSETDSNENSFSFDMNQLNTTLRNLQEKSPTSAFFNLNVLNYELKESDTSKIPIELTSQWTRTFDTITVEIKYEFHSSILPDSICFQNNTVVVYTIIPDGRQLKESSPTAEWSENEHKLWWKIPYVHNGKGELSSTVLTTQTNTNETNDTDEQPLTTSSVLKVYFIGENGLFSSIDFDLLSRSYRISLSKKKILSGKYQSEPDQSEPLHFFKRPSKLALSNIN